LELVGLSDVKNKRIGKYSRGMKQRLGIAGSIIPKPKILLLDEPISALDPIGRKEIFELLSKLRGKMTIVFSTHIIDDIERVSDKIIIINKGKKVLDGSVSELKAKHLTNIIEIKFENPKDLNKFKKTFNKNIEFEVDGEKLKFKIESLDCQTEIFRILNKEKINILGFNVLIPTLEEIFMDEVKK